MKEYEYPRLERLGKKLADDLVKMNEDTAIELQFWGNALEFVSMYYRVNLDFTPIKDSKENA